MDRLVSTNIHMQVAGQQTTIVPERYPNTENVSGKLSGFKRTTRRIHLNSETSGKSSILKFRVPISRIPVRSSGRCSVRHARPLKSISEGTCEQYGHGDLLHIASCAACTSVHRQLTCLVSVVSVVSTQHSLGSRSKDTSTGTTTGWTTGIRIPAGVRFVFFPLRLNQLWDSPSLSPGGIATVA
jgi:hypothetical protein